MNKDIIYIDVDDDVTAIIGKIKTAKEKIVALVPPKRAGALQSAVNLRLLDRMAKNEKKQLVLITHNPALLGLAASAAIPVAKNLQSKPELAEIPALAVDDGDDIIDGTELPVGELAKTVKTPNKEPVKPAGRYRNDAIDDTDLAIDGTEVAAGAAGTVGASAASRGVASAAKKRSGPKIPNFDKFRKKLFLIIGGGVALIALLIWMFVFAPAATVIITASTSPAPVSASVKLGGTAATDFKSGIVSSVSQQDKKDVSVSFTATGQQDMGQKATGVLKVSQLTQSNYTLPAGSQFTAEDGHVFVTQSDATIPASTPCFPKYCAQSTTVKVTASAPGPDYNGESGNATGPNGTVGSFQGTTSGGSSRIATVVTQDDIDRANGQLLGQSSDAEKKALKAKFTNGEIVIDSSFVADRATPVSSPAVGQEAPDGKATLTVTTNYSIQAVPRAALDTYLTAYLQSQLTNSSNQKVYDNGISKAALSNYQNNGGTMTANVDTTGRIGPTIDETAIKNQVKGKLYGEVQQSLQSMNGVKSVDVQFSYFWVQRVPDNPDKITIQFKVDNAQNG